MNWQRNSFKQQVHSFIFDMTPRRIVNWRQWKALNNQTVITASCKFDESGQFPTLILVKWDWFDLSFAATDLNVLQKNYNRLSYKRNNKQIHNILCDDRRSRYALCVWLKRDHEIRARRNETMKTRTSRKKNTANHCVYSSLERNFCPVFVQMLAVFFNNNYRKI